MDYQGIGLIAGSVVSISSMVISIAAYRLAHSTANFNRALKGKEQKAALIAECGKLSEELSRSEVAIIHFYVGHATDKPNAKKDHRQSLARIRDRVSDVITFVRRLSDEEGLGLSDLHGEIVSTTASIRGNAATMEAFVAEENRLLKILDEKEGQLQKLLLTKEQVVDVLLEARGDNEGSAVR